MTEVKLKWAGGIRFEGQSAFGLPIATDGIRKIGGTELGYKPTELVLFGLAGCTAVDVIRILEKQRQKLNDFEIEVKGYQPDEYPKPFNKIEIKYILTGENLDPAIIEQAITLSDEKYCAVTLTLKGVANIITSYEIKEG